MHKSLIFQINQLIVKSYLNNFVGKFNTRVYDKFNMFD